MVNILTTRENRVLSFNSIIQITWRRANAAWGSPWGRSYSYKISNSGEAPIALQGKGLDPNWVTGLVEAESSFMVFYKIKLK